MKLEKHEHHKRAGKERKKEKRSSAWKKEAESGARKKEKRFYESSIWQTEWFGFRSDWLNEWSIDWLVDRLINWLIRLSAVVKKFSAAITKLSNVDKHRDA